jgi:hypothetical protein
VDKEIILAIVNGPGATWGWIALGFFAMITIITLSRWFSGYDQAMAEGRAAERREGLDQLKAQMAKVVFDQQQIMGKLEHRDPLL